MEEKITDAEIDKLRAVVGMDIDSDESFEEPVSLMKKGVSNNSSLISSARQPQKSAEIKSAAPQSLDTELFVKVEEHAAIGAKLSESKGDMKVIADTISLLAKAEKLKSEAISRMESALNKIDADIEEIESKLAAPEGLHAPEIDLSTGVVSDDLIDLRSELNSLKDELGKINK
ncbi:Uncharacterised protein [uncultured archaeon]|nr:Uncharacterised protein [uncultured archaeon]